MQKQSSFSECSYQRCSSRKRPWILVMITKKLACVLSCSRARVRIALGLNGFNPCLRLRFILQNVSLLCIFVPPPTSLIKVDSGSSHWTLSVFLYFRSTSGLSCSFRRWPQSKTLIRSRRFLEFLRSRFTRANPSELELPFAIKYSFKYNSYQIKCFSEAMYLHRTLNLYSNPTDSSHSRILSKEWKIVQELGLIWMRLVRTELTGVIVTLWCTLRNNRRALMRTFHLLLRNWCHRHTIVPARTVV